MLNKSLPNQTNVKRKVKLKTQIPNIPVRADKLPSTNQKQKKSYEEKIKYEMIKHKRAISIETRKILKQMLQELQKRWNEDINSILYLENDDEITENIELITQKYMKNLEILQNDFHLACKGVIQKYFSIKVSIDFLNSIHPGYINSYRHMFTKVSDNLKLKLKESTIFQFRTKEKILAKTQIFHSLNEQIKLLREKSDKKNGRSVSDSELEEMLAQSILIEEEKSEILKKQLLDLKKIKKTIESQAKYQSNTIPIKVKSDIDELKSKTQENIEKMDNEQVKLNRVLETYSEVHNLSEKSTKIAQEINAHEVELEHNLSFWDWIGIIWDIVSTSGNVIYSIKSIFDGSCLVTPGITLSAIKGTIEGLISIRGKIKKFTWENTFKNILGKKTVGIIDSLILLFDNIKPTLNILQFLLVISDIVKLINASSKPPSTEEIIDKIKIRKRERGTAQLWKGLKPDEILELNKQGIFGPSEGLQKGQVLKSDVAGGGQLFYNEISKDWVF